MVPPGYERLLLGHAVAVARSDLAASVRHVLIGADGARSTLHEYAARQPGARRLQGRGAVYAVSLPRSAERVVVRHSHHGGLFAPLTRDVFLAPTRAPYELETSLELAKRGVPSPSVVAYALYPSGGLFQKADVCSREIAGSRDLSQFLVRGKVAERSAALDATARLVATLSHAGARHHDLNAKNVLIASESAYVLDVDRVTLGGSPETALDANLARLNRSLRKWRDQLGASISDDDIRSLNDSARSAFQTA